MHRQGSAALLLVVSVILLSGALAAAAADVAPPPNVVLIFTDDQGYGDLSCFGSKTIRTPNIDRLAREGRKFTSFMVASPVCSPSRAALLTGCYPKRVGMHRHVLFPTSTTGLDPAEQTIADQLKGQGYATACFGKWHLGHLPEVLPRAQGFDVYLGIPYSNDMNHPDNKGRPPGGTAGMDALWADPESALTKWNTPLYENEKIVELPVDQRTVTRRYTQRAIDFIREHRDGPFFVYLPHSMPHIPLYVPDDVRDPDPLRAYITTIEHIVASHDRRAGRYTSEELPRGMKQMPYDMPGDRALAEAWAATSVDRDDTWITAIDDEYLPVHYPTINLLPFLQGDERWVSAGICQTAEPEDFLLFGALLAEAAAGLDRRVVVLASGGLSHQFWPLRQFRDHEAADPAKHLRTPEARAADEQVLAWMRAGDHAAIIDFMPEFAQHAPEGFFGHYLTMVGALGGADCTWTGTQFGEYEAVSGTGQAHVWFEA